VATYGEEEDVLAIGEIFFIKISTLKPLKNVHFSGGFLYKFYIWGPRYSLSV